MERALFKIIKSQPGNPNISIFLPTNKTAPDINKDSLVLKKLFKESARRLRSEYGNIDAEQLLKKLKTTISSIDLRQNLEGLAIFVNKRFSKVVRLPFTVEERVVIDKNFATRDLIRAINRGINYYTLTISAGYVRLFEAHRDKFSEITEGGFPYANPLPRGSNLDESTSRREARIKGFFKMVDKSFARIYNQHPMPFVIAGVERNISLFKDMCNLSEHIIVSIEGNYDNTPVNQIAGLVWPEVKKKMAEKRGRVISKLDEAMSMKKLASGIDEVWKLSMMNRGELLVVEENYHQSAIIDESGNRIVFPGTGNEKTGEETDDLVSEIAEKIVSTGGRVVFTENGSLQNFGSIALVLKY